MAEGNKVLSADGVGDETLRENDAALEQSTSDVGGEAQTSVSRLKAWSALFRDEARVERAGPNEPQGSSYSNSEVIDALNDAVSDQFVRYYDTIQNKLVFKASDDLDDETALTRVNAVLAALEAAHDVGAISQVLRVIDGVALL